MQEVKWCVYVPTSVFEGDDLYPFSDCTWGGSIGIRRNGGGGGGGGGMFP